MKKQTAGKDKEENRTYLYFRLLANIWYVYSLSPTPFSSIFVLLYKFMFIFMLYVIKLIIRLFHLKHYIMNIFVKFLETYFTKALLEGMKVILY